MNRWVLLRGLTREARHWGDFPEALRAALGGADILAPDLPGNGLLNAMPSPPAIEEMATQCREALLRRGIAPPWHLLALSLGGMVAVAWAARHPDEVRACVLINTSLRPFSPFHARLLPRSYPSLLRLALGADAEAGERIVLRLTSRDPAAQQAMLAPWTAYRRERPVTPANALRQLLAAARYRAPPAPPVPTLVLTSRGDALVDCACSQELARRWQCALAVHPHAGHDLTLDDGPWVARQVAAWVEAGCPHRSAPCPESAG